MSEQSPKTTSGHSRHGAIFLLALVLVFAGCDEDELPPTSATVPAYAPTNWGVCPQPPPRETPIGRGPCEVAHYANGLWVGLANNGTWIYASSNGLNWTVRVRMEELLPGSFLQDVRYGGGQWVAFGSTLATNDVIQVAVVTSPDGWTWTPRHLGVLQGSLETVRYGGGVWLAGKRDQGALLISEDAIHWTVQNGYTTGPLVYAGCGWLSVTAAPVGETWSLAVATSRFGRQWTSHLLATPPISGSPGLDELYRAAGQWVARGSAGERVLSLCAQEPDRSMPRLTLQPRDDGKGLVVNCSGPAEHAYRLEESEDLIHWRERAVGHGDLFEYPIGSGTSTAQQFYRVIATPLTNEDDGKHQIQCLGDPFLSARTAEGRLESRWIKFALLLDQPDRVHFQNSSKYLLHEQFARQRLEPFIGMSLQEFDRVSLHVQGQKVVLGSVIFPPDPILPEIGIQFVGMDPYPAEQLAAWFELVRASVATDGEVGFLLLPLPFQEAFMNTQADFFAARGIPLGSIARWVEGNQAYSEGWALGCIRYVPAQEIGAAYATGRLRPTDILLTDRVPAEVPPVAGILSLGPATPNSHVAILARSFGIPFAYVADETVQTQLRDWDGREIALVVRTVEDDSRVNAVLVEGQLRPEDREQILALKRPPLAITPKEHLGQISLPTAGLLPEDIRHVGGKAANFGFLVRSIPDHAPTEAIAFTFDLWDQFLDQVVASGKTLRQTIRDTLSRYSYPPDMTALTEDLEAIRDLIRGAADFNPEQRQAILAALAAFDPHRNIRFRSSTNVEDSERFSGAGLYDSYSGCLADDLDADSSGPSHCDPTERNERGVFRAIKRVYASFYNANAFLERLRHAVNEDEVGMAVLVHYSFPDESEWANGVATLTLTEANHPEQRAVTAELVTQAGAVSVANPEGNTLPEVVQARLPASGSLVLDLSQRSSLVQLGATVLEWPADYEVLFGSLDTAARAYTTHLDKENLILDFEYKKVEPGRLVIKQMREIPRPDDAQTTPPFLLGEAKPYTVLQYSEHCTPLFSNHRLKSVWQFQSFQPLTATGAGGPDLDLAVDVQYLEGQEVRRYAGRMSGLPEADTVVRSNRVVYSWVWGEADSRRDCALTLTFPYDVSEITTPFVVLSDAVLDLAVNYTSPQVIYHIEEGREQTVRERAILIPGLDQMAVGETRTGRITQSGVSVESTTHLSEWRRSFNEVSVAWGQSYEYGTAALITFDQTTITGLTTQPVVLKGHFSQTFSTTHHTMQRNLLFEPALEPGIDPQILAELRAANIKAILVPACTREYSYGCEERTLMLWGYDNQLRPL